VEYHKAWCSQICVHWKWLNCDFLMMNKLYVCTINGFIGLGLWLNHIVIITFMSIRKLAMVTDNWLTSLFTLKAFSKHWWAEGDTFYIKMFSEACFTQSVPAEVSLYLYYRKCWNTVKTCNTCVNVFSYASYGSPFPQKAVCYHLQIEPIFIFLCSLIIS